MKILWTIAILCGALPLAAGIAIFILFYFFQTAWLVSAGILNLEVGTISVAVGLLCLTIYAGYLYKKSIFKENGKKIIRTYALLLANFPVALILVSAGSDLMSVSTVKIQNNSSSAISDISLQGPVSRHDIGMVSPKKEKTDKIHIKGEGSVKYTVSIGTKTESGVLFGYITSGQWQSATISVDEKLNVTVQPQTGN